MAAIRPGRHSRIVMSIYEVCWTRSVDGLAAYQSGQDLKSPTDLVVAIVDGRSLHLSDLGDLARQLGT